jgi:hypothetical protein
MTYTLIPPEIMYPNRTCGACNKIFYSFDGSDYEIMQIFNTFFIQPPIAFCSEECRISWELTIKPGVPYVLISLPS